MAKDTSQLLADAVKRGVITGDQKAQLEGLGSGEDIDSEEPIRPISNFNEVFVTVGVMLLLFAANALIGILIHTPVVTYTISAGICWLTADWFHQRKRFRLPIIWAAYKSATSLGFAVAAIFGFEGYQHIFDGKADLISIAVPLLVSMAVLIAAAARFWLPFLMLPICIHFAILISVCARYGAHLDSLRFALGFAGLAILGTAIHFDLKDPKRISRWSDFAFWSYIVGSPLFVHSLFLTVLLPDETKNLGETLQHLDVWPLVIPLVLVISFVGILINRRALILSTLLYVAYAIFRVLNGFPLANVFTVLMVTVLLIGLYVIALGSRWAQVRRYVMSRLPKEWTWIKRLPPY